MEFEFKQFKSERSQGNQNFTFGRESRDGSLTANGRTNKREEESGAKKSSQTLTNDLGLMSTRRNTSQHRGHPSRRRVRCTAGQTRPMNQSKYASSAFETGSLERTKISSRLYNTRFIVQSAPRTCTAPRSRLGDSPTPCRHPRQRPSARYFLRSRANRAPTTGSSI